METNLSLRLYFGELYLAKKQVAKSKARASIELLNFSHLDPYHRVLKIKEELDLHKKKMDIFEQKEYVDFADDQPHLLNCFLGNLYFCNHQEEEKLLESLVLNETHHLLCELLSEAMAQFPLFTLARFLNNEQNPVFYELNQQPPGTSDKDYAAMLQWQAHMKMECVDLQSNQWNASFIGKASDLSGARKLAVPEKDRVEFLLANAPHMSWEEFIALFSRLRAFCPGSIPEDPGQWHESFCQFVKGNALPYAFSPGSLQQSFDNIKAGKISNAPLCLWSLIKYKKWLGDLLQGKIDLHQMPDCSYEKLFEKNMSWGPLRSNATLSKFNHHSIKNHE